MAKAARRRTKEISCRQLNRPYLSFNHKVYSTRPVPKCETLKHLFTYTCDKVPKISVILLSLICGMFIKLATQSIVCNSFAGIKINARNVCRYGVINPSDSPMNIIFNLKGMAGGAFLPLAN